jgi:hypothetical protein
MRPLNRGVGYAILIRPARVGVLVGLGACVRQATGCCSKARSVADVEGLASSFRLSSRILFIEYGSFLPQVDVEHQVSCHVGRECARSGAGRRIANQLTGTTSLA